jgi:predicted permease
VVGILHLRMEPGTLFLAYTLLLAIVTAAACGVGPAMWATRRDVSGRLKDGDGHGMTARLRLRHAFVIVQVAASVVLLVLAMLFTRTLVRLTTWDTGMDLDHGLVAQIDLQPSADGRDGQIRAAEQAIERLNGIAGVTSSSVADLLPLGLDMSASRFVRAGHREPGPRTMVNSVGPRYFETVGIALRRGREFRWQDRTGAAPAVIVSQAFANLYFPGEEAIGQVVASASEPTDSATVVGVVDDASFRYVSEPPAPVLYFAYAQRPVSTQLRPLTLLVRGAPGSIARPVIEAVSAIDRSGAVKVLTLRDATGWELGLRRAGSMLLASLGLLGLFLAMIGLYGVIRYLVASRTGEIGVRMALGASSGRVTWEIVHHGLTLIACGTAAGFVVAFAAARVARSLLGGLNPADPATFALAALTITIVGLAAIYLPARRAARVDPVVALRCE